VKVQLLALYGVLGWKILWPWQLWYTLADKVGVTLPM